MINATATANQTNQNIDYQPFILTVLNHDELMKYGSRTLMDALKLIPGVDLTADNLNNRSPIVRGSNPMAYGQTKLLIDGVLINDHIFDSYNTYLDLPIELIERIDVVRGSGSFIDGVNGYAGTINVITYAANSQNSSANGGIFGSIGTQQNRSVGFWNRYSGDGWKLASDLTYASNQEHSSIEATDLYGQTSIVKLGNEQLDIGLHFQTDRLKVQGRFKKFQSDSAFGNLYALPNKNGKQQIDSWYLQADYTQPLTSDFKVTYTANVMENGWNSSARSLPAAPLTSFPEGYWADLNLKSRAVKGEISAQYSGFDKHLIKAGYSHIYENAIDMSSITTNKVTGSGMVDYTNTLPFFNAEDAQRHIDNFYLSDYFNINDEWAFSFTAGGIHNKKTSTQWYGRGALVYQPTYNHIFKIMAGNSYRLPSWQEMYLDNNPSRNGNPDLSIEQVKSIEGQYLYKIDSSLTTALSLFYIENKDQIVLQNTVYQNSGQNTLQGAEIELNGKVSSNSTLRTSYSYVEGEAINSSGIKFDTPFAASHLIKMAYTYDLTDTITLSGVWNYVGSKDRSYYDSRDSLDSYNTLNLSGGWNLNTTDGFYAQVILQNIADSLIRYPAPIDTYTNDYPMQGRMFYLRAGWKF